MLANGFERLLPSLYPIFVGAVVIGCCANSARANGRPANTTGVVAGPSLQNGASDEVPQTLVVGLTFGVAISHDAGKSFQWICEDAVGGPTGADPILAMPDAQTVLVGDPNNGLFLSRDAGCHWTLAKALGPPTQVASVATHVSDGKRWLVTTNAVKDAHGRLWQTQDGGNSYCEINVADDNVYYHGVAWSASDAKTMMVAGTNNNSQASCYLFVSHDGGHTFAKRSVDVAPAASSKAQVAIDPTDAAHVLVSAADLTSGATWVLTSKDAGRTFEVAAVIREGLRSIGFSPDGKSAVLGGQSRIYVSQDGGLSFVVQKVPSSNGCVASVASGVWGCGDAQADPFSLARARTPGGAWQPIFSLSRLEGPYHCAPDDAARTACLAAWPAQAQKIGAMVAPPRAEKTADATRPKTGCACAASGPYGADEAYRAAWAIVGLGLAWRRAQRVTSRRR